MKSTQSEFPHQHTNHQIFGPLNTQQERELWLMNLDVRKLRGWGGRGQMMYVCIGNDDFLRSQASGIVKGIIARDFFHSRVKQQLVEIYFCKRSLLSSHFYSTAFNDTTMAIFHIIYTENNNNKIIFLLKFSSASFFMLLSLNASCLHVICSFIILSEWIRGKYFYVEIATERKKSKSVVRWKGSSKSQY